MNRLRNVVAVLSLFVFLVAATACGTENKEVYGKITKISDTKITIETGTYEKPSKPKDGEKPPEKPNTDDSSAPEKASGSPPEGMGGFTSDGGSATYPLSSNIEIADLKEGVLVKLTLEDDTVTAIETQDPHKGTAPSSDSETGATKTTGSYSVDGKKAALNDKNYEAEDANVSAVLVANKGALTLNGGTLTKSGDTTNDEESNFYGLNAILTASGGSTAELDGTTLTSSSTGSNALFATGKGSKIQAKNFKIYTTGNSARGLDATYGGLVEASNGDIITKGTHSAPIATDRGEGTINVNNTSVSSEGRGSPCIYSTGDITANAVTGNAASSQIAVLEGKNTIKLKDCILQGAGKNGIMLYQSNSGDAAKGEAVLKATDSTLTTTSEGPMFYVTNTDASATLENTTLYYSSKVLVNVAGNKTNNWGKKGENGGNFKIKGVRQTLTGDIKCDKISTVSLSLTESTTLRGAVNNQNTAKSASLSLDQSSTWEVTGSSYLSILENKDSKCRNIKSNGHTVFYDADNKSNSWMEGKTISLPGGGKLTPASK